MRAIIKFTRFLKKLLVSEGKKKSVILRLWVALGILEKQACHDREKFEISKRFGEFCASQKYCSKYLQIS